MKQHISLALAAGLLVAGVSAASAGESAKMTGVSHSPAAPARLPSASAKMSGAPHDRLTLNRAQRKAVWADLSRQGPAQLAPMDFHPAVGSVVPEGVTLQAMTKKAASDVPALNPYDFALVQGKLWIVNPADKKIAEVITR